MRGYWNNLRPFEKRVFVGVTALVAIVFNLWFVIPHFSDWTKMEVRRAAAQKKLTVWQAEVAQLGYYSNEVRKLEGEGLSVPPEEQSVQFFRTVQSQAIQSGVDINNFSRISYRTNQYFLEASLNISALSGEAQLVDFLFSLGANNSLVRARDLTLRTDAARQKLNSNVKLVASYQKKPVQKVAAPAAAAPAAKPVTGPRPITPAAKPANAPLTPGSKPGPATNKPPTSIPKRP